MAADLGAGLEPEDAGTFDSAVLVDLAKILPDGRLNAHAATLDADVLTLATVSRGDPQALAELAHRIVSQAGMFGLTRLSDQAAAVEAACRSGEGVAAALDDFRLYSGDVADHLMPKLNATQR